jgi:hypothetical protein
MTRAKKNQIKIFPPHIQIRHSIVASIPACHAGDRGSIPRVGAFTVYCALFSIKAREPTPDHQSLRKAVTAEIKTRRSDKQDSTLSTILAD